MKTRFLIIVVILGVLFSIAALWAADYITAQELAKNPDYVKEKIKQLQEMPCKDMSENHVHEIDHPDHYSAYDEKFIECFGYIP